MNTMTLRYIIEIERAGTVTKAAENLYMAQSNLSKLLRELESDLGYLIFNRTNSGMIPTKKGELFLVHARNIMDQIKELDKLSIGSKEDEQFLSISIPRGSYIANAFVEFVLELDMRSNINISIQETNSNHAIDNVAEEIFGFGIIRYQAIYEKYFIHLLESKQLRYKPIWEFEFILVMSEKHPLAKQEFIMGKDIQEYIEICHSDVEVPYIKAHMGEHKDLKDGNKKIYVHERGIQFELLETIPTAYMWVSPIPENILKNHSLIQRKCKIDNNLYKDTLIYRSSYVFNKWDELFKSKLDIIRDEMSLKDYK